MKESETNARLLTRIISSWNEEDYRDAARYTGHQEFGDFTSYIRNYPVDTVRDGRETVFDPETDEVVPNYATRQARRMPHDHRPGETDYYRPDDEIGIEVVCAYDEHPVRGDNPRFHVVSASTVEISWIKTGRGDYGITSTSVGNVDLKGNDLLPRAFELDMSQGGYFHHDGHFMEPFVAHALGVHLIDASEKASADGQSTVLLNDKIGNLVSVTADFERDCMTGIFYPPEGSPLLQYWRGTGLSMVDYWAGARDAMPTEKPFFNFQADINGDPLNRRGSFCVMNTTKGLGEQRRLQRYFASIVGQLEKVDL